MESARPHDTDVIPQVRRCSRRIGPRALDLRQGVITAPVLSFELRRTTSNEEQIQMASRGTLLYRARWSTPMQICWALFPLLPLSLLLILSPFGSRSSDEGPASDASWVFDLALGLLLSSPLGLVLILVLWLNSRTAMTISTAGIELRRPFGSRQIAWPSISWIQPSEDWYLRGATCVVTTEGERITLRFTASRYTAFRNEPLSEIFAAMGDHRTIPLPTRVAIEFHKQHLRGEL